MHFGSVDWHLLAELPSSPVRSGIGAGARSHSDISAHFWKIHGRESEMLGKSGKRLAFLQYATVAAAVCMAWHSGDALAQTPLPEPNLNLQTSGLIHAMVRQPNGGLVFDGMFDTVEGLSRPGLARLNPDGSLDPGWNPPIRPVYSLSIASCTDNAVYVNGIPVDAEDTQIQRLMKLVGPSGTPASDWKGAVNANALACGPNGTLYAATYERIYKLSATSGEIDYSWQVFASYVASLAFDADGSLYAAGRFTNINGIERDRVAKISTTGEVDPNWTATLPGNANDAPAALALDADENVFVGGPFGVLKLSGTTGAPTPQWLPSTERVYALALSADGSSLYVGGGFAEMGGQPRKYLARLSAVTGIADVNWHPSPNSSVNSLIADADGRLQVAGAFDRIGSDNRYGIATLAPAGTTLATFTETLRPGRIDVLASRPDQSIIAGGDFVRVDGQPRKHAMRLLADGTLDPEWAPAMPFRIFKLAVDGDRSVYAVGDEPAAGIQRRFRILKISGEGIGATDSNWTGITDGWLYALAVDSRGSLYVAGDFKHVNDVARVGIAKLSPLSGNVDANWDARIEDGAVTAIAIDADDRLHAGGTFTKIGGSTRWWLSRLSSADGTTDPGWNPESPGPVLAMAIDHHGHVYAGGGLMGPFAVKISLADGTTLPEWHADLWPMENLTPWAYYVSSIGIDANETVYLAGDFGISGSPWEHTLARFSGQNGLFDSTWFPRFRGMNHQAIAVAADRLYVGGDFSQANDQPRQGLAAFEISLPDRLFATGFEIGWPWLQDGKPPAGDAQADHWGFSAAPATRPMNGR